MAAAARIEGNVQAAIKAAWEIDWPQRSWSHWICRMNLLGINRNYYQSN